MFAIAPIVAAGLISGGASLLGGIFGSRSASKANRERRKEAARNRAFQERMRNTEWQAGVADMEAAGLNPALAYQQGGASSPGGSMATQEETSGISSAMSMKRLLADLALIKQNTAKVKHEASAAKSAATFAEAKLGAYGISRTPSGSIKFDMEGGQLPWLTREIKAGVRTSEANAARYGAMGQIMGPMSLFMGTIKDMMEASGGRISWPMLMQALKGGK